MACCVLLSQLKRTLVFIGWHRVKKKKKIEKKNTHETVKKELQNLLNEKNWEKENTWNSEKKITEFFKRKNEDVEELGLSETANGTNNHQESLKTLNNFWKLW